MSTPSGEGPQPSPHGPSVTPTQIVGQQSAPSTAVPHTPDLVPTGAAARTNSLAMVSLVIAIVSFFGHIIPLVGGGTLAVVAVITGFIARNQIKQTGEQGMTAATLGLIIGIVHLALIVLGVLVAIFFIFVLGIGLFGIAAHSTG